MDALPTFEGCDVLERLRSGPVADLYRAVQQPLGRPVTIKALGASVVAASPFASALEREARLLAQLGHPNVIGLYDFVRRDERMWLVLEHVEGWTLAEVLEKTGKLPQAAALFVAKALASALEHAHEHGVIHRDVRPQHVLLSRTGDVKLTDFSVAADERLPTAPEILSGATGPPSLSYASPEQILGEPPDPRSDLFSLGVVLFELLAGTPPFGGSNDRSATTRIRNEPPPPLGRFVPDLLPALERVVLRCLQKLPSDRFQSAAELGEALELAERELGVAEPRSALVGAMRSAGFETSGPLPQKVDREPTARPTASVGRATRRPGRALRRLARWRRRHPTRGAPWRQRRPRPGRPRTPGARPDEPRLPARGRRTLGARHRGRPEARNDAFRSANPARSRHPLRAARASACAARAPDAHRHGR